MGVTALGVQKVSRSEPKVSIRITNNRYDTDGAKLMLTRVGEAVPFAEYFPVRTTTSYFEFMFDDLLFTRDFGRYLAELVLEGQVREHFYIQYIDDVTVELVSNA